MLLEHPALLELQKLRLDHPTFVPHSLQNFAPGGSSFWQFEHFAGTCDVPPFTNRIWN